MIRVRCSFPRILFSTEVRRSHVTNKLSKNGERRPMSTCAQFVGTRSICRQGRRLIWICLLMSRFRICTQTMFVPGASRYWPFRFDLRIQYHGYHICHRILGIVCIHYPSTYITLRPQFQLRIWEFLSLPPSLRDSPSLVPECRIRGQLT